MEKREIGIRVQDIQTGLQQVDLGGPASGLFNTTLITGMAERLAIHIRGVDIITDESRLNLLADRLGINSLVLPMVLDILEEAEFISVVQQAGRIKQVTERVPYFQNIYERFGEIWANRNPREEEQATVQLLNNLAVGPRSRDQIEKEYSLDKTQLEIAMRVGNEGGYFSEFTSSADNARVVYSPLYWEERPEETFNLINKYGSDRLAEAIRKVRVNQGIPLPELGPNSTEDDKIIVEAMVSGLLPAPEVASLKGPKRFGFTPYQGQVALRADERPVLQKARAVLACIRYGQHFGTITRVGDPEAIVRALHSRGRIGPHTEIAMQYAILVVEGVARVTPDTKFPTRYHLEIIDTDENKKALAVAADMLAIGEAITERGLDPAARSVLFGVGTFKEPLTTRAEELARQRRQPQYSPDILRKEIEKLIDQVRQV